MTIELLVGIFGAITTIISIIWKVFADNKRRADRARRELESSRAETSSTISDIAGESAVSNRDIDAAGKSADEWASVGDRSKARKPSQD